MSELKKTYKSIMMVPIKVEMAPVTHTSSNVLSVDELSAQIEEARKGKAKVDNEYVEYSHVGHLFEYKYDYVQFLDNMQHIITQARAHKKEDRYKNDHRMIIQ